MRLSRLFGTTLRAVKEESDFRSYEFLLRAGYIRQLSSGIYSYLHLAHRSIQKVQQIIREEMDRIDAQEINMPVVHPAEIWRTTGRYDSVGSEMIRFQDRKERDMVLAMTHEEVVGFLAASEITSYKQLPVCVYQLQTKFRDEPRARGGLIRVREFVMKDSYSMDLDEAGLDLQYQAHYKAYFEIGRRCSLPLVAVQSDTGMMGGKAAHEFMYLTPGGEDELVICTQCGYAANQEVAEFQRPAPVKAAPEELELIATPNAATIEEVAAFLNVSPEQCAKTLIFMGTFEENTERPVICVVRGDMTANQAKVRRISGATALRAATPEEVSASGTVAGYASPRGLDPARIMIIVDSLVAEGANFVIGANQYGHHFRNGNFGRDFTATHTADIAAAKAGSGCITCGAPLTIQNGVEVGNIFKLGTRYTAAFNAQVQNEAGKLVPIIMGSYGIGVGRLFGCICEEHCDDDGLVLPLAIAPYAVALLSVGKTDAVRTEAERVYNELRALGVEVLYDDRNISAGIKFKDADLRGIPLRLTISDRTLERGEVEFINRKTKETWCSKIEDCVPATQEALCKL